MKKIKPFIISVVLSVLTVISSIPAGAMKLTEVPKNTNYHYGLDVSTWNGSLNMKQIKNAGVEFAIIRIGYYKKSGGYLDVRFKENVKKCVENGIEFGVYVYSYVYKKSDNLKCAKWVHKQLKALGNYCKDIDTIPVAYDIEDKTQTKAVTKGKISRTYLYQSVCKFSDKIKSYGYIPVVYSFQGFFMSYLDITKLQKKGYKIWYAQWPYLYHLTTKDKKVMYNGTVTDIWQFSDALTIGGKVFDTNVCYDDFYNYKNEDSKLKVKEFKEAYALGNKSSVKPSAFKVYSGSTLLKKGKDYKLIYFKNKRAGKAKIKIIRYKNKKYLETKTLFFYVKPAVPQKLKTKSYLHKMDISWKKSAGASYYEIQEKDVNDDTYNTIDVVKTNTYTNTDLNSGSKIDMRIRAVYDKNGKVYKSKYAYASDYTKYTKVKIESVTSEKKNYAEVKWTPKSENAVGYEIKYSTDKNFSKNVKIKAVSGIESSSKTIKLTSGKKYYFKVRAVNEIDTFKVYSNYSDILNVKIK